VLTKCNLKEPSTLLLSRGRSILPAAPVVGSFMQFVLRLMMM